MTQIWASSDSARSAAWAKYHLTKILTTPRTIKILPTNSILFARSCSASRLPLTIISVWLLFTTKTKPMITIINWLGIDLTNEIILLPINLGHRFEIRNLSLWRREGDLNSRVTRTVDFESTAIPGYAISAIAGRGLCLR